MYKRQIEFDTIIQEYIRTAIQEYEVRDTLRLMLGNHSIKNALFVYIPVSYTHLDVYKRQFLPSTNNTQMKKNIVFLLILIPIIWISCDGMGHRCV